MNTTFLLHKAFTVSYKLEKTKALHSEENRSVSTAYLEARDEPSTVEACTN